MCLVCDDKNKFVAKEDITVYKIVYTDGANWVGPYIFNKNTFAFDEVVCANTDNQKPISSNIEHEGKTSTIYVVRGGCFHSFTNKIRCIEHKTAFSVIRDKLKMRGFFIFPYKCFDAKSRKTIAVNFSKQLVCECTIPKGTVCYKDDTNMEIASEKLIVHKPKELQECI